MKDFPLIFERSVPGRRGFGLPGPDVPDVPLDQLVPSDQLRSRPRPCPR